MIRYFYKALVAHVRAGYSLYVLTVIGVALGVASVLSIQIINRNALAAFVGSVAAVSGDADLTVLGRTPTFPERLCDHPDRPRRHPPVRRPLRRYPARRRDRRRALPGRAGCTVRIPPLRSPPAYRSDS
jgi:hypothetical protein